MLKKVSLIRIVEILILIVLFIFTVGLGVIVGKIYVDSTNQNLIDILENYNAYQLPTVIYDANGEKITEFREVKRRIVSFEDIPPSLTNAFLLMEDKNFFDHPGFDIQGILRAAIVNMYKMKVVEGGSTITQQLAKLLLTEDPSRTFERKIIEVWYSLLIEKHYTKNEILEKYFNLIPFGGIAYGVDAASNYYFGKNVKDLDYIESAILAMIPPAPNRFNPFENPKIAKERHKIVLEKMVEVGLISRTEMLEKYNNFWDNFHNRIIAKEYEKREDKAPYFSEFIKQELEKEFEKIGLPAITLSTGGYKVYTTLDLEYQRYANVSLQEQLKKQNKIFYNNSSALYDYAKENYTEVMDILGIAFAEDRINFSSKNLENDFVKKLHQEELPEIELLSDLYGLDNLNKIIKNHYTKYYSGEKGVQVEGAIVAIDPFTGYIKAMVGGSGISQVNFLNRVFSPRQPGSAFKPFVYASALEKKQVFDKYKNDKSSINAATVIVDEPITFKGGWMPKNDTNTFRGPTTLRDAIRFSINVVSAKLIDIINPQTVVDFVNRIIDLPKDRLEAVLSLALGTKELSPMEMACGYSTFANGGYKVKPVGIIRVYDRNNNLIINNENSILTSDNSVMDKDLAYLMVDLLRGPTREGGTAYYALQSAGINYPVAGKTGTNANYKDAWFCGFTPNLVAVVWIGFDQGAMSLGYRQYGGTVAAPVWAEFIKNVYQNRMKLQFNKPKDSKLIIATVCTETGLLVGPNCHHATITDMFLAGSLPKDSCNGGSLLSQIDKMISELGSIKLKIAPKSTTQSVYTPNVTTSNTSAVQHHTTTTQAVQNITTFQPPKTTSVENPPMTIQTQELPQKTTTTVIPQSKPSTTTNNGNSDNPPQPKTSSAITNEIEPIKKEKTDSNP